MNSQTEQILGNQNVSGSALDALSTLEANTQKKDTGVILPSIQENPTQSTWIANTQPTITQPVILTDVQTINDQSIIQNQIPTAPVNSTDNQITNVPPIMTTMAKVNEDPKSSTITDAISSNTLDQSVSLPNDTQTTFMGPIDTVNQPVKSTISNPISTGDPLPQSTETNFMGPIDTLNKPVKSTITNQIDFTNTQSNIIPSQPLITTPNETVTKVQTTVPDSTIKPFGETPIETVTKVQTTVPDLPVQPPTDLTVHPTPDINLLLNKNSGETSPSPQHVTYKISSISNINKTLEKEKNEKLGKFKHFDKSAKVNKSKQQIIQPEAPTKLVKDVKDANVKDVKDVKFAKGDKPEFQTRKVCFTCLLGNNCTRTQNTYFHISPKANPLTAEDVHRILGKRLSMISSGKIKENQPNKFRQYFTTREISNTGLPQCDYCHVGTCERFTNGFFHFHNNVIPLTCEQLAKLYNMLQAGQEQQNETSLADQFIDSLKKDKFKPTNQQTSPKKFRSKPFKQDFIKKSENISNDIH